MAFIKLPQALTAPVTRDSARPLAVRVFVGEIVDMREKDRGVTLGLQSKWSDETFELPSMPIACRTGNVMAIASLAENDREIGMVVAAANLDRDEKVEFLARETEIAATLGPQAARRRGAGAGRALLAAAAQGVGAAALAVSLAAFAARYGGETQLVTTGTAAIAALVGAMTALHVLARRVALAAASAPSRRAASPERVERFWDAISDVLGFAQDHRDVFRPDPADRAAAALERLSQPSDEGRRMASAAFAPDPADRWPTEPGFAGRARTH